MKPDVYTLFIRSYPMFIWHLCPLDYTLNTCFSSDWLIGGNECRLVYFEVLSEGNPGKEVGERYL